MTRIKRIVQKADIQKAAMDAVLRKLRAFLDKKEPELVYFLYNNWRLQEKAITYKELREAILAGQLSIEYLQDWQQDYTRFVTEHLRPAWMEAIEAGTREVARKYPDWYFDPYAEGVQKWCEERAASFVVEISNTQWQGLNAVVARAALLEDMTVDQLARAIRPMVGLYDQQCTANLNYYTNLINNGVSEKKAQDLAYKYAAKQHRYRGYNIARTELAFSYNQGAYEAVKQAQEKGYMGEVVKVWSTAADERVCPICGGLNGKVIAMDDDFEFQTKLAGVPKIRRVPPAHPSCRCGVMFKEINPAKKLK